MQEFFHIKCLCADRFITCLMENLFLYTESTVRYTVKTLSSLGGDSILTLPISEKVDEKVFTNYA